MGSIKEMTNYKGFKIETKQTDDGVPIVVATRDVLIKNENDEIGDWVQIKFAQAFWSTQETNNWHWALNRVKDSVDNFNYIVKEEYKEND